MLFLLMWESKRLVQFGVTYKIILISGEWIQKKWYKKRIMKQEMGKK